MDLRVELKSLLLAANFRLISSGARTDIYDYPNDKDGSMTVSKTQWKRYTTNGGLTIQSGKDRSSMEAYLNELRKAKRR